MAVSLRSNHISPFFDRVDDGPAFYIECRNTSGQTSYMPTSDRNRFPIAHADLTLHHSKTRRKSDSRGAKRRHRTTEPCANPPPRTREFENSRAACHSDAKLKENILRSGDLPSAAGNLLKIIQREESGDAILVPMRLTTAANRGSWRSPSNAGSTRNQLA